jgi:hypothetical protein
MFRKCILIFAGVLSFTGSMLALRANAQADSKALPLEGGATLFAELDSSLDSKKTKAEEKVEIRTTDALKIQGKVIFPKGTKIVGHVMQALARGKGDADSLLAIQFDKAVLKGGEEVPVRLAIKAIAPARQNSSAGDAPGQDPMAGTRTGTASSPMGTSRTDTTTPNRRGGSPGSADDSTGTGAGLGDQGQLTPESHGVYGMSGVRLAADVSKTVPVSVVSSTGKNLRLDSGTRMLLVSITDVPAKSNP